MLASVANVDLLGNDSVCTCPYRVCTCASRVSNVLLVGSVPDAHAALSETIVSAHRFCLCAYRVCICADRLSTVPPTIDWIGS